MTIYIASDHAGLELKSAIIKHLKWRGNTFVDEGPTTAASCDYSDFAKRVSSKVASEKCARGILICGTGIGMSIAANKLRGIRCAMVSETYSTRMTRLHNDANVIAIGARTIGQGLALEIVDAFLDTPFSDEDKHIKRIKKVMDLS